MYSILTHTHSGLRWIVLITLLIAIGNAIGKTNGNRPFLRSDKRLSLMALVFTHLQLVLGLILYFISPKVVFSVESMSNDILRFFLVEHIFIMILAVLLITIGYSRSKRAIDEGKKFRNILVFYLLGLLLILAGIPWPFQDYGTAWF
ncbi:cytochrome B [Fulvivirga sedimenti]|uniref:Cytochrome B n=1 Tax=Fulvivirga sedimenti TaxID=2879465 RepID=A0A9X1HTT3_9BACT|nr:cytochrome B [Fulvivirga sedimenti]MCA6075500.1 cytochrome B [Fulvivirga sedimenti]MCA6076677.1 cytochrome B [Fulvivirga sedimenti]MCA6077805.1 cytochrome B [Fulvivirga sedimenti]